MPDIVWLPNPFDLMYILDKDVWWTAKQHNTLAFDLQGKV
jgi:hypothetical protein